MGVVRLLVMLLGGVGGLLVENVLDLGLGWPVFWAWLIPSGVAVVMIVVLQGALKVEANSSQWWTMMLFVVGAPAVRLLLVAAVPSSLSAEPWLTALLAFLAFLIGFFGLTNTLREEQSASAPPSPRGRPAH